MKTFSHYGFGVQVHGIERRPDGRVEFTLWFTVFWIPIFPLSSWSGRYAGGFHDYLREHGHAFTDLVRIQRDPLCYIQTFTRSILIVGLAIAPAAMLIHRTTGRARRQWRCSGIRQRGLARSAHPAARAATAQTPQRAVVAMIENMACAPPKLI